MQRTFHFTNGYGATVIDDGYGSEVGLFELAVLDRDGNLDHSTPITDDVIGWLDEDGVQNTLEKIKAL